MDKKVRRQRNTKKVLKDFPWLWQVHGSWRYALDEVKVCRDRSQLVNFLRTNPQPGQVVYLHFCSSLGTDSELVQKITPTAKEVSWAWDVYASGSFMPSAFMSNAHLVLKAKLFPQRETEHAVYRIVVFPIDYKLVDEIIEDEGGKLRPAQFRYL